ncbi:MAG: YraN family protein [Clostridia bacterium]|nr:YraN family protein [Clostridia bacterium]
MNTEKKTNLALRGGSKSQKSGAKGERRAALYLRLHGYRILERNWLFHNKEIDIIAQKGELVAFVEVKSRRNISGIPPRKSVTQDKRRNLILASKAYIARNNLQRKVFRYDIIEVDLSKKLPLSGINHIKHAFEE